MQPTSSRSSAVLPPEGEAHLRLREVIFREQPREAVGFLTADGRVIELPNHSSQPEDNFEVHKRDLLEALSAEPNLADIIFWHSHPLGGIGPSRTDMQQKIPHLHHLVASIVGNDLVYTFY